LPAELLELVLEFLPVADLMRVARASRRLKEMVYEDSRWVRRLKAMGVWDEGEARGRELDGRRKAAAVAANGTVVVKDSSAADGKKMDGWTLFDAADEEARDEGGFTKAAAIVSGSTTTTFVTTNKVVDPLDALTVLKKVKSVRGRARGEYAKIHAALAPYYFDVTGPPAASGASEPLMFRTYREPEQQATMLAQLRGFELADWASGRTAREARLTSISALFEGAALREFESAMRAGDFSGRMRRYAYVLYTLNGGAAAADAFIDGNIVMTRAREGGFGRPRDCITNAFSGQINLAPAEEYFRRIAGDLNEQVDVLDAVFPMNMDVHTPFIERLVEDVISEYITELVDEAHEQSMEAYLKAVSGVFELSLRFGISVQPSKSSSKDFKQRVKDAIIRCFEPHIDLYLQEEFEFFKRKAENEVDNWEKQLLEEEASTESFFLSNISRQAAKQDFLSSFKNMLMLPVTAVTSIPTAITGKKSTISTTANMEQKRASTPVPVDRNGTPRPMESAPTTELAAKAAIMNSRLEGIRSLFSIEVALSLVHTAKASLERAAQFVKPLNGTAGEAARAQCETIFVTLVQILGTRHVQPGLDKAVTHLAAYRPREMEDASRPERGEVVPLVTFLELVNVGDLIQQMVDVFYAQELVAAGLSDSDDFLAPGVKEKKRFEQMLDERVAAGLNKGIDVLMEEVEYICATTQKPEDFNPLVGPNGQVTIVDIGPSEAAKKVVEIVEGHVGMLVGSIEKTVLDVFNQEVGVRLFSVLCKHIKRQRISVEGAIKLIRFVHNKN
jgi:recyclin-1